MPPIKLAVEMCRLLEQTGRNVCPASFAGAFAPLQIRILPDHVFPKNILPPCQLLLVSDNILGTQPLVRCQPERKYRAEAEKQIAKAGCRTRKDSVRVVEALVTASPEFFKGKKRAEIRTFFEEAVRFITNPPLHAAYWLESGQFPSVRQ